MKKNVLRSLKLTVVMILLCAVLYPLLVAGVGKMTPGNGKGVTVAVNGRVVGYEKIGQKFTDDKYFWGRPSAVDYNASGSAGSNKGPSNPDYLQSVQDRIDSFLAHNPGVKKKKRYRQTLLLHPVAGLIRIYHLLLLMYRQSV